MKSLLLLITGIAPEKLSALAAPILAAATPKRGTPPAPSGEFDYADLWRRISEFVNSVPLPDAIVPWMRWTLAAVAGIALVALLLKLFSKVLLAFGQWPRFGKRRADPGFLSNCFALVYLVACYLLFAKALPIPAPYGGYAPYAAYGLLAIAALGTILNLIHPPKLSEEAQRKLQEKADAKAAAEKAKADAKAAEEQAKADAVAEAENRKKREAAIAALNARLTKRAFDFAEDIEAALAEAEGYRENKLYDLAIAGAEQVLNLPVDNSAVLAYDKNVMPRRFAALLVIADVYNDIGDNVRARKVFASMSEIVAQNEARIPRDKLCRFHLTFGIVLRTLDELDAAIDSFDKALKYANEFTRPIIHRLRSIARMKQAEELIGDGEGEDEDDGNRELTSEEKRFLDKVVEDCFESIRQNPYDDEPMCELVTALQFGTEDLDEDEAQERIEEVRDEAKAALKKTPPWEKGAAVIDEGWADKARQFSDMGDTATAMTIVRRRIRQAEQAGGLDAWHDYPFALSRLANLWRKLGDTEKAVALLTQAIELSPTGQKPVEGSYYYNRAMALTDLGEWDEAIKNLEISATLHPDADTHHQIGYCHANKGNWDKALESYARSIELHGDEDDLSHHNMAICHFNKGDYDKAIAEINEALRLNPKNSGWVAFLERAKNAKAAHGTNRKMTLGGTQRKCPSCGEILKADMSKCPSCAHEISGAAMSEHFSNFITWYNELAYATYNGQASQYLAAGTKILDTFVEDGDSIKGDEPLAAWQNPGSTTATVSIPSNVGIVSWGPAAAKKGTVLQKDGRLVTIFGKPKRTLGKRDTLGGMPAWDIIDEYRLANVETKPIPNTRMAIMDYLMFFTSNIKDAPATLHDEIWNDLWKVQARKLWAKARLCLKNDTALLARFEQTLKAKNVIQ